MIFPRGLKDKIDRKAKLVLIVLHTLSIQRRPARHPTSLLAGFKLGYPDAACTYPKPPGFPVTKGATDSKEEFLPTHLDKLHSFVDFSRND